MRQHAPNWRGAIQSRGSLLTRRRCSGHASVISAVTVLPFEPDPRLLGAFLALVVTAAAVSMGLALRRVVGRYLAEDDPRRQLVAQVLLYAGTFIVIAVSVWLRHR